MIFTQFQLLGFRKRFKKSPNPLGKHNIPYHVLPSIWLHIFKWVNNDAITLDFCAGFAVFVLLEGFSWVNWMIP